MKIKVFIFLLYKMVAKGYFYLYGEINEKYFLQAKVSDFRFDVLNMSKILRILLTRNLNFNKQFQPTALWQVRKCEVLVCTVCSVSSCSTCRDRRRLQSRT